MEKHQLLNPQPSFIDTSEEIDEAEIQAGEVYLQHRKNKTRIRSLTIHFFLLVLNLFICTVFLLLTKSNNNDENEFNASISFKQANIQEQDHSFDLSSIYLPDGSINNQRPQFGGPPREELLESWSNLTQYMNVRLQPEELGQFRDDENVIQLTDGSGAFGTLAVYHGIHCINRLHRFLYQDFYYADITEPRDVRLLKHHAEHCIDWLRQYIQCNADLTVIPMYWGTNNGLPLSTDTGNHRCVNWDSLQDWMKTRSFNAFQPGLLMHPVLGSPYAKHESNKIGFVEHESLHSSRGNEH